MNYVGLDKSLDRNPHVISSMFDNVALHYNFINLIISLGKDRFWRKQTCTEVSGKISDKILDLAAGTGVSTVELAISGAWCIAADSSLNMLTSNNSQQFSRLCVDAARLPFDNNIFDIVIIIFGLRNITNPVTSLCEVLRVTRTGGRLVVCEFSMPEGITFAFLYKKYLFKILPYLVRYISNNPDAYTYLAESIQTWPNKSSLTRHIKNAGWSNVKWRKLTGGTVAIHSATKL